MASSGVAYVHISLDVVRASGSTSLGQDGCLYGLTRAVHCTIIPNY